MNLRVDLWNNFQVLGAIRLASSCMVLGQGKYWLAMREFHEGGGRGVSFGLVWLVYISETTWQISWLLSLGIKLALERAVSPPACKTSEMSKQHKR